MHKAKQSLFLQGLHSEVCKRFMRICQKKSMRSTGLIYLELALGRTHFLQRKNQIVIIFVLTIEAFLK